MLDASMISFLAPAFVASLILTGIHAYLGVHVVERGVIFVDLSLAQIAALGATIAIFLPASRTAIRTRRSCTGSASRSRSSARSSSRRSASQRARIPKEAIIGICYAVASAAAILAMSKATSESEHLKDMLVGNILAVSWAEVGKTARPVRRRSASFTTSSGGSFSRFRWTRSRAEAEGISIRFWDFLFYASFGFVVTSSVSIAGVLLVFCYLIVPSVAAMLYAEGVGQRLAIGWSMGTIVSALGVYLSLQARSADRRDHRLHVRAGADPDGGRPAAVPSLIESRAAELRADCRPPMTCRKCGIEIADKAIVCYKCGTATTDPVFAPPPARPRGLEVDADHLAPGAGSHGARGASS